MNVNIFSVGAELPAGAHEATRLLGDLAESDPSAVDSLLPLVYDELRNAAEHCLRDERPGHTLQATALVHEVYLRLVGASGLRWQDRSHFLAIAARSMRQVLINHALQRKTAKRGGQQQRVALDDALTAFEERSIDLLALNEALNRLAEFDLDQAKLVELRFFGGLTAEETATLLGWSLRTVEREWVVARAWLRREIEKS